MNTVLPYELELNRKIADIPLPDENLAWADMRRRLEEDDNRKPLAWWRRGCLLWGIVFLALFGLGWLLFHPEDWFRKNTSRQSIEQKNNPYDSGITINKVPTNPRPADEGKNQSGIDTTISSTTPGEKDEIADSTAINTDENVTTKPLKPQLLKRKAGTNSSKPITAAKRNRINEKNTSKEKVETTAAEPVLKNTVPENDKTTDTVIAVSISNVPVKTDTVLKHERAIDTISGKTPLIDSTKELPAKTVKNEEVKKKDSLPKKSIVFGAGIGIYQQIPVGGQKINPYNSLGRKSTLADYIPSIFLRMEKTGKWFLQGEFRYGAPVYTRQLLYRQNVTPDTGFNPRYSTVRTSTLKKTFYHQLPLTFNLVIAKGWSAGAGIQWNKFQSAVSEQKVSRLNNFTQQDSLVSKLIITDKSDTVFRKSYFQAVIGSQYKWKRFSFGLRYSFGLEPYIEFQIPGSERQREKNNSFQITVQYLIWRSKKE